MTLFIIAGMLGPWQIALIVAAVVLLFGGRKIPELMKGLGQGMKEFKNATKDKDNDKENEIVSEKDDSGEDKE